MKLLSEIGATLKRLQFCEEKCVQKVSVGCNGQQLPMMAKSKKSVITLQVWFLHCHRVHKSGTIGKDKKAKPAKF